MSSAIEQQAMELLRRHAGRTLTMQQLYALLVKEVGPAAGSYHELQSVLKRATLRFQLLQRADPFGHYPLAGAVREAYQNALDRAGLDMSPMVTVQDNQEREQPGIVGALQGTLESLCSSVADDTLREQMHAALSALTTLEAEAPTTTPLPDPLRRPRTRWRAPGE